MKGRDWLSVFVLHDQTVSRKINHLNCGTICVRSIYPKYALIDFENKITGQAVDNMTRSVFVENQSVQSLVVQLALSIHVLYYNQARLRDYSAQLRGKCGSIRFTETLGPKHIVSHINTHNYLGELTGRQAECKQKKWTCLAVVVA